MTLIAVQCCPTTKQIWSIKTLVFASRFMFTHCIYLAIRQVKSNVHWERIVSTIDPLIVLQKNPKLFVHFKKKKEKEESCWDFDEVVFFLLCRDLIDLQLIIENQTKCCWTRHTETVTWNVRCTRKNLFASSDKQWFLLISSFIWM